MSTNLFLQDTYLFSANANIAATGADDKGTYIVLDQTIFYPQGGGQPADQGKIYNNNFSFEITFVRAIDGEVRHYCIIPEHLRTAILNTKVTIQIDQPRRLLNARYHTAAHFISNIVEKIHPELKAVKGHSFPGEGYVEFLGNTVISEAQIQQTLNTELLCNYATSTFEILPAEFETQYYKLPYPIPADKTFRAMQIGNFTPVPCGGTHVRQLAEIGTITLRKFSPKQDRLKISYALLD